MPDNVYRFRRLKWADPDKKLTMLPGDKLTLPRLRLGWEYLGIAVCVLAISSMLIFVL